MSVNPGFGGQVFIPHSIDKIRRVRAVLDRAGNTTAAIEVDGGIDLSTVESVVAAGAEWLVAGNAVFSGGNAEQAARALKAKAEAVTR
jgi:ribulose-phosphate 3-epimerase